MNLIPKRSSLVRAVTGLVFGALALTACKEIRIPGVYRIDIQQGNVITQEQLAALEPGMEKRKVRFILGTPLVTDTFNQQRWDYYYSFHRLREDRVQRIISVFFEDDRLSHIGGDVRAASGPIELPDRVDKVVVVPDGYRNEGLLASLTPDFFSNKPKRQPRKDDEAQSETKAGDAQADTAAAPARAGDTAAPETTPAATPVIEIDAEEERYLRDLLFDLGRAEPSADILTAASEPLPEAGEQEEGVLSRWAKTLGWGGSESSAESVPSADTPPPAPIE